MKGSDREHFLIPWLLKKDWGKYGPRTSQIEGHVHKRSKHICRPVTPAVSHMSWSGKRSNS